mgnify:CR=1 FL=1
MEPTTSEILDVPPYHKLAEIYDLVMSHIDYEDWVGFLQDLCGHHGIETERVFDISCGTGKTLPYMDGWCEEIYGMDLSFPMVKQLVTSFPEMRSKVWVGDMSALPVCGGFPLILNLQDSVNYYLKPEEFLNHLHEVHSHLTGDGYYLFDLSTELNVRRNFLDFHEVYEDESWGYERVNTYLNRKQLNITEFYIWEYRDRGKTTYRERHFQRMYTSEELTDILKKSPFRSWWLYGDITLRAPDKDAERIHVVASRDDS